MEEYSYLVTRHFCDEEGTLYEVINTYRSKDPDTYMATVFKMEEKGCLESEVKKQIPILGETGVRELVRKYEGRGLLGLGSNAQSVNRNGWKRKSQNGERIGSRQPRKSTMQSSCTSYGWEGPKRLWFMPESQDCSLERHK